MLAYIPVCGREGRPGAPGTGRPEPCRQIQLFWETAVRLSCFRKPSARVLLAPPSSLFHAGILRLKPQFWVPVPPCFLPQAPVIVGWFCDLPADWGHLASESGQGQTLPQQARLGSDYSASRRHSGVQGVSQSPTPSLPTGRNTLTLGENFLDSN